MVFSSKEELFEGILKMGTPDYVLTEQVSFQINKAQDPFILPQGSFVRPINDRYIPAHIKNDPVYRSLDKKLYVFCFTRYGLIPIEKKLVRKV